MQFGASVQLVRLIVYFDVHMQVTVPFLYDIVYFPRFYNTLKTFILSVSGELLNKWTVRMMIDSFSRAQFHV
jgi:hypothetical protein